MSLSTKTNARVPWTSTQVGARRVVRRTQGHRHGPVTRLMSPSDLGELLRPFVFLDHIDTPRGADAFGLHPHSGIATVTWIMEGNVSYEDTTGETGKIPEGGLEWMQAGGGVWHGGGFGDSPRIRGFQLWLALPPELELGPAHSIYSQPDQIQRDGPVAVLLGRYGTASSGIRAPSPVNYLSVSLKAGEQWTYHPPTNHTVGWAAVSRGILRSPDSLQAGELAVFAESSAPIDFHAVTDVEFVLGSAVKHPHDLVLGHYSVHTNAVALREGEANIRQIASRLRTEGRLT
ncbi:MAG: Redox-sensitive bicupin YhaK, pirin superfamily [Ramlibacter sp.]|nr:Redox-sensitive bicupin YhaK, pirin superfamily [Ramlibacter sp.]